MKEIAKFIKEGLKITSKTKVNDKIKIKNILQLKKEISNKLKESKNILDLTDLDISDLDDLSHAFYGILNITKVDVTGWNTSNVKSFNSMFYGCTYLEEVIGLDTWDVSNVEDMSFMFNDCKNLKNIGDISGWEINDTKMHGAFYNCKKLKTIGQIYHWKPRESNYDIFTLSLINPKPKNRV